MSQRLSWKFHLKISLTAINWRLSKLGNNFHFIDWIPKDLIYGKFQCILCNMSYFGEYTSEYKNWKKY